MHISFRVVVVISTKCSMKFTNKKLVEIYFVNHEMISHLKQVLLCEL